MALLCLDDNGLHQEITYCPWQTKLETRQEIADYLIRRLREKNYAAGTWFTAQNLVGENQVDWKSNMGLKPIIAK